jgi:xylose dehydrogenase (NAD/NADP)
MHGSPRHELVAIASRELVRAEAYAAEWRIPRAYGSYEELLSAHDVDAIYIPLPNALHASWTITSLAARKHVLCEKPVALSLAEIDAIEAASRANGRIAVEAFMYRHHPLTDAVRQQIARGGVGRVRIVRGAFSFRLTREGDVRFDPSLGGGSLWDVGCYPVSYARFVLGEEPVEAIAMADTGPTGVDLSFAGQLRFDSGALLQFDCSFVSDYRTLMEFVGTDGVLSLSNPFKPGRRERVHLRRGDTEETLDIAGGELYQGELDDMADAVFLGTPPRVSLNDSRGNVRALVALLDSAREGRAVRVATGS